MEGVTVMRLARSFAENLDDVFRSGNFVKLHCDVVSHLKNREGDLKFKMEILRSWSLICKCSLKSLGLKIFEKKLNPKLDTAPGNCLKNSWPSCSWKEGI